MRIGRHLESRQTSVFVRNAAVRCALVFSIHLIMATDVAFAEPLSPPKQHDAERQISERMTIDANFFQFLRLWESCFQKGDAGPNIAKAIEACDHAVAFPFLRPRERERLMKQRGKLVEIQENPSR